MRRLHCEDAGYSFAFVATQVVETITAARTDATGIITIFTPHSFTICGHSKWIGPIV
jgi:hypothetical protein